MYAGSRAKTHEARGQYSKPTLRYYAGSIQKTKEALFAITPPGINISVQAVATPQRIHARAYMMHRQGQRSNARVKTKGGRRRPRALQVCVLQVFCLAVSAPAVD